MSAATHTNRLAEETSPYLLQHAHNPVNWWPWGPEALAEATARNKPILLSIGYAACHWCHVMAHESFEDAATAAVMNELFINIKVDREERPDIDQIYMSALHYLGEQGGWPLTMFLSPDGRPFWGGTYFPKRAQFGRPAFTDLLHEVARVYRDEPDKILKNAEALQERLAERAAQTSSGATVGIAQLDDAAVSIARATDPVHGGLRGAPKFPQCAMLDYLWRAGARSGDDRFFTTFNLTLQRMSQGGIYDHLGGGYARYSVDERWLVPHFEKMLYDNAQILDLLALEHARAPSPLYSARAAETIGWLIREMRVAGGAFASSLDADSEGEEGKFYVWSKADIDRLLGDAAATFDAVYDVTAEGNFEGHTILNRLNSLDQSVDEDALAIHRVRPGLDDKILADWNGLMIAALAHAARAFARPDWLGLAQNAYAGIRDRMMSDGRLGHSYRDGRLVLPGLASDHAAMTRAALALYETTGDQTCLDQAIAFQGALEARYPDIDHGGYFLTADNASSLIVRPHSTIDDAIPNHNGLIADNLVRLAALTGDSRWAARRDALFDALLPAASTNVFGHLSLLNALDLHLAGAEIVVTGEGPVADVLLAAARALPHGRCVILAVPDPATLPATHPAALKARTASPAVFVCRGQTCSLPVTTPEDLQALMAAKTA